MTTIKPTAWAVYGRKTGSLRDIVGDDETARDLAEYYDVVPLYPAATPPADDVREAVAKAMRGSTSLGEAPWEKVRDIYLGNADRLLTAFEVRPRGTVTDTAEPYEYCVVNGLGRGIYMAKTLEEAREGIARDQRVGPGELRPKRSIVRRRRAGKWETFS
ncbi:hypothetical protein [Microbacterium enclense]|uniref:hypothetical protein n=1 Tax=Microbacterium enclense TaxID=993073 RepID=UPI003433F65B